MFVIVNQGAGCLGSTNYGYMMAHEIGHGLGFGHHTDSSALMYYACCNNFNVTDNLCASYLYPAAGPTPTPTPTPTPSPTPTPGPTPTPTPTPTPSPTPTPGPTPTPSPTPTPGPTPTPSPTPTPPPPPPTPTPTIPPPAASFTYSPSAPFATIPVQFTDTSTGGPTAWSWNFGDGTSSSQRHPVKTFANPGAYTVSLTASNPGGSTVASKVVTVSPTAQARVVPVIARLPGLAGSNWRSDVVLSNPSGSPLPLELRYTPAAGQTMTRLLTLQARESRLLEDPVQQLFSAGNGRGPLAIHPPPTGPQPSVLSRTFDAGPTGNLGQSVPALPTLPAGTYIVTGLLQDAAYRSNIAVTAGPSQVTVIFDLFRGTEGIVTSSVQRSVPANTQAQWTLANLFPDHALPGVPMSLRMTTNASSIPYASLVDQVSNDAVTIIGMTAADAWVVPVIAHNPGQGGTFWRSDLAMTNLSGQTAFVDLEFLPENQANPTGVVVGGTAVGSGQTILLADVARTLFGVANGKGTLLIRSNRAIAVASRVYTTRLGDGGTLGHGVPAFRPAQIVAGPRTLPGIRMQGGFRSNVGFVTGDAGVTVNLTLRDADGSAVVTRGFFVPARSMRQLTYDQAFGADVPRVAVGSVSVTTTGPVAAYVATVDGSSQDPVFAMILD